MQEFEVRGLILRIHVQWCQGHTVDTGFLAHAPIAQSAGKYMLKS